MRGRRRAKSGRSRSSPVRQPKNRWLSVPSSWGTWGATPECATTGRDPSALTSARLIEASSTLRFHVGTCCSAAMRAAKATEPVPTATSARSSRPIGSSWPHHSAIEGWWPSRSTSAPACRDAWRADAAGVGAVQRHVLPHEQARLVGRVVQLRPGDVRVDAHQVEAGLHGEVDVAPQLGGRGLAERHAGRAEVGALEEQPLAVHRRHPAPHADRPQAGAQPPLVARHTGSAVVVRSAPPPRGRRAAPGRRARGATTARVARS